jgi:hypothetical protein
MTSVESGQERKEVFRGPLNPEKYRSRLKAQSSKQKNSGHIRDRFHETLFGKNPFIHKDFIRCWMLNVGSWTFIF